MMPTISRAGVEVRDAGRSELPEVRRVLLGAYREYAEALPPAVFGRYLTDILDVEGRLGAGRVLAASHGGRVVGTVTFYADAGLEGFGWPAGWAGLRALGVERSARGAGVGQALVEACLERARAAGAPVRCLHTAEFMTAAVAIYERLGFRRDPAFDFDGTRRLGLDGVRPIPILAYKAAEYYHEDALLEFPQSGERFRGKANIQGWRQQYPARLDFEPRRIRGGGDLWVAEAGLRYDGGEPVSVVKILQFRGDRIERETLYFADPFPAPEWRRPWAEEGAEEERQGDLPAHVAAGN